jgi:hypothetical protein
LPPLPCRYTYSHLSIPCFNSFIVSRRWTSGRRVLASNPSTFRNLESSVVFSFLRFGCLFSRINLPQPYTHRSLILNCTLPLQIRPFLRRLSFFSSNLIYSRHCAFDTSICVHDLRAVLRPSKLFLVSRR